jgi:hypothetical protein
VVEDTQAGRRSAEEPSIGALPGPCGAPHASVRGKLPDEPQGDPSGARVMVAAEAEAGALPSSKASTWSAHPAGGSGGSQASRRPAQAQGESALEVAKRRKAGRGMGRSQEPSSPQGARDGSRLQKSVRRIFPDLLRSCEAAQINGAG